MTSKKIIIGVLLLSMILLVGCSETDNMFVSVFGTETPCSRIIPCVKYFHQIYNCNDVAENHWRYPSSYDEVFNLAFETCNEKHPQMFKEVIENYSSQFTLTNSSKFSIGNLSSLGIAASRFVFDCSLPEANNYTVEIVFGEAIYNNTNSIEIPFTEFCKKLEK